MTVTSPLLRRRHSPSPEGQDMNSIQTDSGVITYDAIRKAMNSEPYTMSLTGKD